MKDDIIKVKKSEIQALVNRCDRILETMKGTGKEIKNHDK
jgi:hypothetical protein